MPEPDTADSSRSWRQNPTILAAIIGGIFAVLVAVVGILPTLLKSDDKGGAPSPTSTPVATATGAASRTAVPSPTAAPGLKLLSPTTVRASASSTLAPQTGNTYDAANTIDGDPQTAWAEGRPGAGIGASITWSFGRSRDLRRVMVLNGYAKKGLFFKNLRIRAATITTAQGQTTAVLGDVERYQRLPIQPGSTDFVRLQIDSVYGSRKYQDCLLSEIEFYTR